MKVIGVDPSFCNFGITTAELDIENMQYRVKDMHLVESQDNAKKLKVVRKNSDDLRRARLLYEGFTKACEGVSFAFVEIPVGSQSARAMASYGICIGVLASCSVPMIQVTATEVKLAGTGIKTATKEEMIEAAIKMHPYAPWMVHMRNGATYKKGDLMADNEHLADALFAIEAGIWTDQFKQTISFAKALKKAA